MSEGSQIWQDDSAISKAEQFLRSRGIDVGSKLKQEDVAVLRRLWQAVMEGTVLLGAFMKALYAELRVGGGVFKGREMSKELEEQTYFETEAYVAALLTILLESWPNRPSDPRMVVALLELVLFEIQREEHRVNLRARYEGYRARYREKRREDLDCLPRELVVHTEFAIRIGRIWPPLGPFSPKLEQFIKVTSEVSDKMEAGPRKVLSKLWPPPANLS